MRLSSSASSAPFRLYFCSVPSCTIYSFPTPTSGTHDSRHECDSRQTRTFLAADRYGKTWHSDALDAVGLRASVALAHLVTDPLALLQRIGPGEY